MTVLISSGRPMARRTAPLGVPLGYLMVLLDMTVPAVAEPDLAASLRTSVAGLQWATTGYTVAFGALLLSAGAVADRYGAQRVFRCGVAAFGAVSAVSAFAPALEALVARPYPGPAERARAVAVWAAVSGAAVAAGPAAGACWWRRPDGARCSW
ncbi:MFS transporter [Actinomadura namibiensis]|uniref:MFS transporter n=1 Tax=Actinomadura kijaniata TaxID=46161 RepID=UPI003611930D